MCQPINKQQLQINLCPQGAQTCALPLCCDRDLEINPMTVTHEGDIDILTLKLKWLELELKNINISR